MVLPDASAASWLCPAADGAAASRIEEAKAEAAREKTQSLPRLELPASEMTVSGISSGGAMAMQLHVAHSSRIVGAGIFAGPAYGCALADGFANSYFRNAGRANDRCISEEEAALPVAELVARIRRLAASGRIDPVASLRHAKVWLFCGTNDRRVPIPAVRAVEDVYRAFVSQPQDVVLRTDVPAGHGWPTKATDSDPNDGVDECAITAPPYFNACGVPATREMLQFVLGRAARGTVEPGRLVKFDQRPFRAGRESLRGLGDAGYVCLPTRINRDTRIHVSFHGCCQSIDEIGNLFPIASDFLALANAFNLVVLFPQAAATIFNPKGCWDWWGYTEPWRFGSDEWFRFPTGCGVQIAAIMRMVEALTGTQIAPRAAC